MVCVEAVFNSKNFQREIFCRRREISVEEGGSENYETLIINKVKRIQFDNSNPHTCDNKSQFHTQFVVVWFVPKSTFK